MALVYGIFYRKSELLSLHPYITLTLSWSSVFLTNMSLIFVGIYHEKSGIAGLNYIALGIGLTLAAQVNARFMDRIYVYYKKKNNSLGEPEFRLRTFPIETFFALFS